MRVTSRSYNEGKCGLEICGRYEGMMDKYPHFKAEIAENIQWALQKKVLPTVKALQFTDTPIIKNNSRIL